MSLSSPARSFNLHLFTSLLRPSTAHVSPPDLAPSFISRKQSSPSSISSTVSQTEVSHFSRLASSWWDPHGSSRLLHLMNPLRHDFINSCLDPLDPNTKYTYLDIGCGGGIFSSSAARLPSTRSVTAIDPTQAVVAIAKAHQRSDPALSEPKLRYLNCAIEDLPLPLSGNKPAASTAADIITLFEVLEHINSPAQFLQTTIPHLQFGGYLISSTIAHLPVSLPPKSLPKHLSSAWCHQEHMIGTNT
jgi:polyprenyldihydroxybenzoate methyltransferase/3-demethylubiquinol 3-O-methyltransferase